MKRPPLSGRHLDVGAALDHLEGRSSAGQRRAIEDHLAGSCDRCRRLLLEVSRMVESMQTDRVDAVPAQIRARALAVFPERGATATAATRPWRLALLVFDSLSDPLPAMVRRTVGEARWLRYSLGESALEMEIEPEPAGAWSIRGRLLAPDAALYRMEVQVAAEVMQVRPDAEGRFALEHVPGGEAEVLMSGPEERFRLPRITL